MRSTLTAKQRANPKSAETNIETLKTLKNINKRYYRRTATCGTLKTQKNTKNIEDKEIRENSLNFEWLRPGRYLRSRHVV